MSVIEKIGKPFRLLAMIGDQLQSIYLLLIRVLWGALFFYTGMGKLNDITGTAGFFDSIGIYFPLMNAYLVGFLEYVGGACLLLGIATRAACVPLSVIMLVALFTAHYEATVQFFQNPGLVLVETPTTFLIALLTLFVFGPGIFSVDQFFSSMQPQKR